MSRDTELNGNRIIPAGNYIFKVNNRSTRKRCEICSKLTIKTPERCFDAFIVNLSHISHLTIVFLALFTVVSFGWKINPIRWIFGFLLFDIVCQVFLVYFRMPQFSQSLYYVGSFSFQSRKNHLFALGVIALVWNISLFTTRSKYRRISYSVDVAINFCN